MFKKAMLSLGVLLMVSFFAYAEDKFAISGEVSFPKRKGEIQVKLETESEYMTHKQVPEDRKTTITLSAQQLKSKKASFEFVNVLAGDYVIFCFQDLSKNGKLDFSGTALGQQIPEEPWGFYKSSWPRNWGDSKFKVDRDITGIKIDCRR